MCNEFQNRIALSDYFETFDILRIPLSWTDGGASNLQPLESIRISDRAPVVRWTGEAAELGVLPWSWKAPNGRPVFNFRSDGRSFGGSERCLIPADGFFEFTAAEDPASRRKDRWRFAMTGEPWFWIAGLIRDGAFAMLTAEPGPDVGAVHDRQVVVLKRPQALDWLRLDRPEAEIFTPPPAGMLVREKVDARPAAAKTPKAAPPPAQGGFDF